MPRVPEALLKCTFFLYPTEEDARAGKRVGGTGFLIAVPLKSHEDRYALFGVTNWHVAVSGDSPVIRINRKDGGVEVADAGPDQWHFIPSDYDVAIIPIQLNQNILDVMAIRTNMFISDQVIADRNIGPGESVMMVGRFVDHDGAEINVPALRFGHISMMPLNIRQENRVKMPSYCIDVHSRTGFSGSPVFAYRVAGDNLHAVFTKNLDLSDAFLGLLGIHWGQFPEEWELIDGKVRPGHKEASGTIPVGQSIKGLSGMTCVAPAAAIIRLLETPRIQAYLAAVDAAVSQGM
jgi:hypothetical protein